MNQNENMGVEITLAEENESSTAIYDLPPDDFDALAAKAIELQLEVDKTLVADTCVCCPERAEHWFKLIPLQTADYSFTVNTQALVGAQLYKEDGEPLASDNVEEEKNIFPINYTLTQGKVYYLRVMPKYNFFMRFNTVITGTFAPVESIILSTDTVSLVPNQTVSLLATVLPENATSKTLLWESSNPEVVKVALARGTVRAVSPGTATIYAKAMDGSNIEARCQVNVSNYHYIVNKAINKAISFTGKIDKANSVCARRWNNAGEQIWKIHKIPSKEGCYVRTYYDEDYGFNAYKNLNNSYNCDLFKILGNEQNAEVLFKEENGYYKIFLAKAPNYCLTLQSNEETVKWENEDEAKGDCQLWKLHGVDWEKYKDEHVEYHLLCNGDPNKALRVGKRNTLEFNEYTFVRGERLSYWNRQKWTVKGTGDKIKIYTQLNKECFLCNYTKNGMNEVYVSKLATDEDSDITIIPYGHSGDLCEIKLTNRNLYLSLVECNRNGVKAYWGEWKAYDSADHHLQLWKFVQQPVSHHYGVDTDQQIDDTTARVLKLKNKDFVMRYYGMLDKIGDILIRTKSNGQSIVGKTIEDLREKDIKLEDVDYDYLQGVDNLFAGGENITYASKTVTPEELKRIRSQNMKLVVVYQNNGKSIEDFTIEHAKLDAFCALVDAKRVGQPYGTTIYFAVDFDPNFLDEGKGQKEIIKQYFSTLKDKINGRYKVGVYGTAKTCDLIKPNYADFSWLACATGATDSSIEGDADYIFYDSEKKYDIKQSELVSYNGIEFDSDTSIGSDYGQW